jgi:hypothetical protein
VCLSGVIRNILPFTSTMQFNLIPKKDALCRPFFEVLFLDIPDKSR